MKNKSEVLESIKGSKKLNFEEISAEKYERKAYLSTLDLENGRMLFRVHSRLVPTIRKNYASLYRRKGKPLTCPSCTMSSSNPTLPLNTTTTESSSSNPSPPQPVHSQSHLLTSCEAVRDIREECQPWEDDKSLAEFFRQVVARHLEMGEE